MPYTHELKQEVAEKYGWGIAYIEAQLIDEHNGLRIECLTQILVQAFTAKFKILNGEKGESP